jgi:hypothetical protein
VFVEDGAAAAAAGLLEVVNWVLEGGTKLRWFYSLNLSRLLSRRDQGV